MGMAYARSTTLSLVRILLHQALVPAGRNRDLLIGANVHEHDVDVHVHLAEAGLRGRSDPRRVARAGYIART
jgi:hypothetical protein